MRIGIDIDDTFTETKKIFSKYLKKYRKEKKIDISLVEKMSNEMYFDFLNLYGDSIYRFVKEKKHASRIVRNWGLDGIEVYFVTARSEKECREVEKITKEFFRLHDVPYRDIIFRSQNKYEDTKCLELDVFIDDRESVLDSFPKNDMLKLRMVPNKMIYSKYQKVTNWKEIDAIIQNLM